MKRYLCIAAVTLGGLALAPAVARADHKVSPGNYEITRTTEANGQQMPPMTLQRCVTPDDAKDLKKVMEQKNEHAGDCKMTEFKAAGSHVTFAIECSRPGATSSKGTGDFTYSPTGYDGTMKMEINAGPRGPMQITTHVTAKRTGDCPK